MEGTHSLDRERIKKLKARLEKVQGEGHCLRQCVSNEHSGFSTPLMR